MRVTFVSNVIHDGRNYGIDDTIDLPVKLAEVVIASGAAVASESRSQRPITLTLMPKIFSGDSLTLDGMGA